MGQAPLKLQQQNAEALAKAYSPTFRKVEIISILTFWSLSAGIVWRLAPYTARQPWLVAAAFMIGFVLADFVSGVVHWMADTWGSTDMPVLGNALIRPFREHHVDEKAMTHHDFIETNGANCMVAVPVALACLLIPLEVEGWQAASLFGVTALGSMIFWVMMTNQFHKWSHYEPDEIPALLRVLHKWHIVLPPAHHQVHHTPPFDSYYCITSGWLNWPLQKIGFFRKMERMVTALTGAIPRRDDIGIDAALAIAPLPAPPRPTQKPSIANN